MTQALKTFKQPYPLTTGQKNTFTTLLNLIEVLPVIVLQGSAGSGKTQVLKKLAADLDVRFFPLSELLEQFENQQNSSKSEETLNTALTNALKNVKTLIIDDIDIITAFARRSVNSNPRIGHISAILKNFLDEVVAQEKHVVLSLTRELNENTWFGERSLQEALSLDSGRAVFISLPDYTEVDYVELLSNIIGKEQASRIDVEAIRSYSSNLSGNQIVTSTKLAALKNPTDLKADDIILELRDYVSSNLDSEQVEQFESSDLKGTEELWQALETHVLLPMRGGELVSSLELKPKRGVVLYGNPGTGKTSIGRALAHKMKGKFFMIDGSIITEPPNSFFNKLTYIFAAAEASNPSIIFIDDADVLFSTSHVYGLNRYLLSKLDGLVSSNVGNVCIIMTAMDVNDLPPALVRSGRIELWLETRLPELEVRAQILARYSAVFPEPPTEAELQSIATKSKGFTPADLRRITGDAKALLAQDDYLGKPRLSSANYLLQALDLLQNMRKRANIALGKTNEIDTDDDLDAVSSSCCG
ncbi:MAG: ATP-dependent zinc metalloprotease FtsH 4 [Acinetobacter bereziniae]|uniref:ATP-dependent zinc metalloprotease FtsH 4 n=1 Tax=Acinetobacter bereziniae TaxID=106648 RepID=A0A833PH08_ACIBZ|nr:MAG: ATP-dependent zinc metalloprotease FtsH 4 [Acinetobacter bereziniae]